MEQESPPTRTHTDRSVSSTPSAVLSHHGVPLSPVLTWLGGGGGTHPWLGGGIPLDVPPPIMGYPHPDLAWGGGTPIIGYHLLPF